MDYGSFLLKLTLRKAKAEEEKVKIHTQVQRSESRDSAKMTRNDWDKLEQKWSKTQKQQIEEGLQAAR